MNPQLRPNPAVLIAITPDYTAEALLRVSLPPNSPWTGILDLVGKRCSVSESNGSSDKADMSGGREEVSVVRPHLLLAGIQGCREVNGVTGTKWHNGGKASNQGCCSLQQPVADGNQTPKPFVAMASEQVHQFSALLEGEKAFAHVPVEDAGHLGDRPRGCAHVRSVLNQLPDCCGIRFVDVVLSNVGRIYVHVLPVFFQEPAAIGGNHRKPLPDFAQVGQPV